MVVATVSYSAMLTASTDWVLMITAQLALPDKAIQLRVWYLRHIGDWHKV
jgi:hypothetical protein